ncbi:MAG TPA: 50S ribosomal protein L11 methyltransferase [Gaiellaceae bacterium]|nr:50S ribosomal protein L11 methyltransferase [Gaiellaceae bacterium]
MSIPVPPEEAEAAVARLLELVPEGHEVTPTGLAVYVDEQQLRALTSAFPAATVEQVEPGWEDAWRRFHTGVRIGPFWVGPPWEQPPSEALPIVIDPGRAFGTGAHPTTRLAVELLAELEPGSLLDVGCGSGVIAIAAAKLGFVPVRAGDTDAVAIEVTRENARRNGVTLEAAMLDARTDALDADIVIANIALDVVEALATHVRCRDLVLSGYLAGDRPAVPGLVHVARRERDGWAADSYRPE